MAPTPTLAVALALVLTLALTPTLTQASLAHTARPILLSGSPLLLRAVSPPTAAVLPPLAAAASAASAASATAPFGNPFDEVASTATSRAAGAEAKAEAPRGGDGGSDGGGDGGSGGDGDSGAYLRVTPLEHPAVSVQPLPSWLPRTQRHLGALTVELMQGEGGPVCFGNTVTLRGRGGRYVDVEGGTVGARWSAAGAWQVRPHPIVPPRMLPPSTVLPRPLWQALRLERCGSEASYTSRAAPGDADADVAARVGDAASRSVVCHGDILCVRAHTGRLLRLAADATEGGLPELSATAESHEDAQRWEVLLA